MMKQINVQSSFLLILLSIAPVIANAQAATQTLSFSPESSITVDGTSNRDNWTVTAQSFEGQVTMNNNGDAPVAETVELDRKSTRLNSSHVAISYAVFCLKKKKTSRVRQVH